VSDVMKIRRAVLPRLWLRGHLNPEGSSNPKQLAYLADAARGARLVGEIGFNTGLSAHAFLGAGAARVVSFDLGDHRYTPLAKKLVDRKFPGRHTMIWGDSRTTVPEFTACNPGVRFDVVFIDGGHDYEIAKADITNMKPLCTDTTVVVMDDLTPWLDWGAGPTRAWTEAIQEGIVRQEQLFKDGEPVDVIEPPGKRIWAVGRYIY
jgi:hypothetical protein